MSGIKIIVVDDDKNIRRTLADILGDCGLAVRTAESGEEAVRMCTRSRFDLVLMDVRLPGIDGVEAVRRIRRRNNEIPVIMMSAYTLEDLEKAALSEGDELLIVHPVALERGRQGRR